MKQLEKYTDGMDMEQFKRIDEISSYNYNYYNGFGSDLLFCESDDIDTSQWFLVSNQNFYYLGLSFTSDERLYKNMAP